MRLIHDVTTDPGNPPAFLLVNALREQCKNGIAYSGLTGEAHRRRYPDLQPVVFERTPLDVFYAAYDLVIARKWFLVNARKWRLADGEQIEGRIEATVTTRSLLFKDDVVIRLLAEDHQDNHGGTPHQRTRVDLRSASRVGRSDLGVNARRVRAFLFDLKNVINSNT